jgi:hypothetical protein
LLTISDWRFFVFTGSARKGEMKKPEPNADRPKPQVVYVPPEVKIIDRFAQDVCDQLAQSGNPACADPEIVTGFAAFMNFAAEMTAKHLNQKNHIKEGV